MVVPLPCCELVKTCHQFRFRNSHFHSPAQSHPKPAWLPLGKIPTRIWAQKRIKDPRRLKTSSRSQSSNATKPLLTTATEGRTGGHLCIAGNSPNSSSPLASEPRNPESHLRKQTDCVGTVHLFVSVRTNGHGRCHPFLTRSCA